MFEIFATGVLPGPPVPPYEASRAYPVAMDVHGGAQELRRSCQGTGVTGALQLACCEESPAVLVPEVRGSPKGERDGP